MGVWMVTHRVLVCIGLKLNVNAEIIGYTILYARMQLRRRAACTDADLSGRAA